MADHAVLTFHETALHIVDWKGEPWLRGPQIAGALGYNREDRLADLYARNAAEFTDGMTEVLDLPTAGGVQPVRIFSLRGAHLLGMLARTDRAAEFRRWVLDVLEGREAPQQTGAMTYSQRLAYLRERRILLKNLADVRDKATGLGLHENLRAVSGLLHLGVPALESLAPALRQLPIPGTDTTPTRAAT
jgi:prophage antirepressor-like protein